MISSVGKEGLARLNQDRGDFRRQVFQLLKGTSINQPKPGQKCALEEYEKHALAERFARRYALTPALRKTLNL